MIPNPLFLMQPKFFWANVRTIGAKVGYTEKSKGKGKGQGKVKIPTVTEICTAYAQLGLSSFHIVNGEGALTELGEKLVAYFEFRARSLNEYVRPRLMDGDRAKKVHDDLKATTKSKRPSTMNKQKGIKTAPAYFTCIINMLIDKYARGMKFDSDPRDLTTVTLDGMPLRTLARRVDGAFPSTINPVAIWEIKEYYYTTSFGSRVADGVYETLLDGLELEEIREHEDIEIQHLLMIDAYYTWWVCGKSYLCRIIDMLHMGYVDEVLFGFEVMERLPQVVGDWMSQNSG